MRQTLDEYICPTCHVVFGEVEGFDLHRDHSRCLDPRALGMFCLGDKWITVLCTPHGRQATHSTRSKLFTRSKSPTLGMPLTQQALFDVA